jgi:pimeloyl-ACP methyl ester carboxylesterase
VYAGHSWGAAIAARAALVRPPDALVLLDGAYVSPAELTAFGAKETIDARIADIRAEHETYRWPSLNAYLESARESTPRWNEDIEAMALEGMRRERGEVLPPFDSDELEAIFRAYEAYDATSTLAGLADHVCVLLVVPPPAPAHAAARNRLLERFARLVPEADVREVDSPHDLIWGLGPSLGDLIGDWLRAEVAA